MPKANQKDKGSSSSIRSAKGGRGGKGGKAGRGQDPESIRYSTLDDALEAGVQAEENGERWSVGYKAQKSYESALKIYKQATGLDSTSADAFYNVARVEYLLSTSFYLPPTCIQPLIDSINSYKKSLSLAPPIPENPTSQQLPSSFTLDVLYNLGVALQTLGELIDEIGAKSLSKFTRLELPSSNDLLSEAALTFEKVSKGQERVLKAQREDLEESGDDVSMDQDQEGQGDETMEEDEEDGDDAASHVSAFTSSLITPATHLETLCSLYTVAQTALSGSTDVKSPEFTDSIQLLNSALSRSNQVIAENPDGEDMSAEDEWVERLNDLKFSELNSKVLQASKMSELESSTTAWPNNQEDSNNLEGLEQKLIVESERLIEVPTEKKSQNRLLNDQRRVQLLCDLGDSLMSLSKIRFRQSKILASNSISNEKILGVCSTLSAKSTKCFTTALAALDTSSSTGGGAAVLGAANSSTQTSRTRASISTSLSILCSIRSDLLFSSSISVRARRSLLDSSRIWSRRSISENGLGWILTFMSTFISNPSPSDGYPTIPPKEVMSHLHSPGGWETLRNEADSLLSFLRNLWLRKLALESSEESETPLFSSETNNAEMMEQKLKEDIQFTGSEIQTLSFVIWNLVRRKDDMGAWGMALMSKPNEEEAEGLELNRFLDDLISEIGMVSLSLEERAFWKNWFEAIKSNDWRGIKL